LRGGIVVLIQCSMIRQFSGDQGVLTNTGLFPPSVEVRHARSDNGFRHGLASAATEVARFAIEGEAESRSCRVGLAAVETGVGDCVHRSPG
jgi:hypothetical protein